MFWEVRKERNEKKGKMKERENRKRKRKKRKMVVRMERTSMPFQSTILLHKR